jgi:hypothetical protein
MSSSKVNGLSTHVRSSSTMVTSVNSALVLLETVDHLKGNTDWANQSDSILQFILSILRTTKKKQKLIRSDGSE